MVVSVILIYIRNRKRDQPTNVQNYYHNYHLHHEKQHNHMCSGTTGRSTSPAGPRSTAAGTPGTGTAVIRCWEYTSPPLMLFLGMIVTQDEWGGGMIVGLTITMCLTTLLIACTATACYHRKKK